jgi:hypothetical protein
MVMLIYIILRRLCLDNEQNAMINMKNDVVKNIQKLDDKKKIPSILPLKKPGRYTNCSFFLFERKKQRIDSILIK